MKGSYQHILDKMPPEHKEQVASLIEQAQDPYRTIFLDCCGKVRVLGVNGVLGTKQGRAMSLPVLGLWVDSNLKSQCQLPGQVIPTWYSVLFHEVGHTVDYTYRPYKKAELNSAIRKDVRATLVRLAHKVEADKAETLAELMMSGNKASSDEKTNELMQRLGSEFVNEVAPARGTGAHRKLGHYATGGISDVYGGVTGNRCMDLISHPKFYWSWFMRMLGISPGLEFFADTFSDGILGFESRIKMQETYLPTATHMLTGGTAENPEGAIWKIYNKLMNK